MFGHPWGAPCRAGGFPRCPRPHCPGHCSAVASPSPSGPQGPPQPLFGSAGRRAPESRGRRGPGPLPSPALASGEMSSGGAPHTHTDQPAGGRALAPAAEPTFKAPPCDPARDFTAKRSPQPQAGVMGRNGASVGRRARRVGPPQASTACVLVAIITGEAFKAARNMGQSVPSMCAAVIAMCPARLRGLLPTAAGGRRQRQPTQQ